MSGVVAFARASGEDFGIGRIKGSSRNTQSGSWLGTPNYVAPEQVQGGDIDGRADQSSFGANPVFVGLDNYVFILSDPIFWRAVVNTLVITNGVVFLELVFGVGLALLMTGWVPGKRVVISLLLLPYAVTEVSAVVMWRFMLQPDVGLINYTLQQIGLPQLLWATDRWQAMLVITVPPAARISAANFSSTGISCLHGKHHTAQKLSITRLPRIWEGLNGVPSRFMKSSFGAGTGDQGCSTTAGPSFCSASLLA